VLLFQIIALTLFCKETISIYFAVFNTRLVVTDGKERLIFLYNFMEFSVH